jgi:IS5 family transposase
MSFKVTLDPLHELVVLSGLIPWGWVETEFAQFYDEKMGRPALPIRRMVGLLILKYLKKLSDEQIVAQWPDNLYYQFFCGDMPALGKKACDPSQMTYFRNRIGCRGANLIFKLSVMLFGEEALDTRVAIDSTIQPKYTIYPSDHRTAFDIIRKIYDFEDRYGLALDHYYDEEIERLRKDLNFSKSKEKKEAYDVNVERMREIALNAVNEFMAKARPEDIEEDGLEFLSQLYTKALTQEKTDKNKVLSIHEPEVIAFAKGKDNARYEYGSKFQCLMGMKSKIILAAFCSSDSSHDSQLIGNLIDHLDGNFGYKPEIIVGDLGYRGVNDVSGVSIVTPDLLRGIIDPYKRAEYVAYLECRSAIEAEISYMKNNCRLDRNELHWIDGDKQNGFYAAAAYNFAKKIRMQSSDSEVVESPKWNMNRAKMYPERNKEKIAAETLAMARRISQGKADLPQSCEGFNIH